MWNVHVSNKFVAVNMALTAFTAERRAAAPLLLASRHPLLLINISCPRDRRSAANPPHAAAAVE